MYIVNGGSYDEDPGKKLGGGSEGAVYPFADDPNKICVKIFHPADPNDQDEVSIAIYRAKKVQAITDLKLKLPKQFVIPKMPVRDARGNIIGYLMARVPKGYVKLMQLLKPAWRTSNSVGLKEIALLYAYLFEDLGTLEQNKIVFGDVNLGCNMVRFGSDSQIKRFWVDMDSPSYPGFTCLATTEMFCHPDLYPNLTGSGTFVRPTYAHDRFAFATAFCLLALHGAHPFRMGVHASATSLQERAQEGITVFDSSIAYPSFLPSPDVLSDDLLQALIDCLKRKTDAPLDPAMLRDFADGLVFCSKCDEQYHGSRTNCPNCHEKTIVDFTALLELLVEELYAVPEALLFAQVLDDTLYMACRRAGNVDIVTLSVRGNVNVIPTDIPAVRGARYRFFDSYFIVCPDPYAEAPMPFEVYRIKDSSVQKIQDLSTNGLENDTAVFDTSARFLYRTVGNTLMCGKYVFGKQFAEDPVTQVHQSQTWFTVDRTPGRNREVIFGNDRALRETKWFVIKGDVAGENFNFYQVALSELRSREKLEDFAVYFSENSVLLVRSTKYRGRQYVRYSFIALDGTVLEDRVLSSDDEGFSSWENIHGKLFQPKSILHVTPEGVVKQTLETGTYGLLQDTHGVITAEDRLFKFVNRIGVARRNAILSITKKK